MTGADSVVGALLAESRIDAASPTPLYIQLLLGIRELVESGNLRVGDGLPSERDLAAGLGISRVTVRKAVRGLVKEGLITQRHGAGNFVAAPVVQPLSRLTSFTEDMCTRGMRPSARWLERTVGIATPREAMALNLSPGTPVSRLHRLRCADTQPMALELATVPQAFLQDPETVETSLYETLADAGFLPERALQHLRAELLTDAQAALLEVPAGSAGLYIERQAFLPDGRPVEFTRSHYRSDSYDFVAELHIDQRNIQRKPQ